MKFELLHKREIKEALACKSWRGLQSSCKSPRSALYGWDASVDSEGTVQLRYEDERIHLIGIQEPRSSGAAK